MIDSTDAYRAAVVGDARQTYIRAVVDISDPDIVYGSVAAKSKAAFANDAQMHDKKFTVDLPMATLETNRWLLNGEFDIFPDNYQTDAQVAYASETLSGNNGVFAAAQYAELQFSGVGILQACSVYFSDREEDGYPVDFTVEVKQGGTAYFTKQFTDNAETHVSLENFTVYNPDAIRVTVTKWSLPYRRMRVLEIIAGIYEEWGEDALSELSVTQQGDPSCAALPYGTCVLGMGNRDRRFEPRAKVGLFQSISERQGIDISIGVKTEGGVDYKRVGVFYQYSGGWKESSNGLSMQWSLVDIIGLLSEREFIPPGTLPTTLEGWIAALAAQLGVNFQNRYTVDAEYAGVSITARNKSDITGKKCGDILRFACMAAGAWPRADAETGYLTAEPLWSQGNRLTIDNIAAYPVMKANDDVASIIFTLADGNDTQYVVGGTNAASPKTINVQNPFIHTAAQALTAARLILANFGGNRLETTGRGDPSSEIGDVETVELDEYSAMSARRVFQTFSYQNGVLQGCQSALLQADGWTLYRTRVLLTESGTWTAPAGVTSLFVAVGQGGQGGMQGSNGSWSSAGEPGRAGAGGKIWYGTISINSRQTFAVSIGAGGAASAAYGMEGAEGRHTTFGAYSSANGRIYTPSYTDVANGDTYGRTGVQNSRTNTSDGGAGGAAGQRGVTHTSSWTDAEGGSHSRTVIDQYPRPGGEGKNGASGFVLIYYNEG